MRVKYWQFTNNFQLRCNFWRRFYPAWAIISSGEKNITPCPICSELRDVETSFYKYAAPEYDRPLPTAAAQLIILQPPGASDIQERHIRRCPRCGTLYAYRTSYEYFVNGSEDEEELTRLTAAQAAEYHRTQARALEALRQEIDSLECDAASLSDYLDYGNPPDSEKASTLASLQAALQSAAELRQKLTAWVEYLRQTCPETVSVWANAHLRVCQFYLSALTEPDDDVQMARSVAQTTHADWEQVLKGENIYIPISTYWLADYLNFLDKEIDVAQIC